VYTTVIAGQSSTLYNLIYGNIIEAEDQVASLNDINEDTFTRFA
jgi:hypothetical protein